MHLPLLVRQPEVYDVVVTTNFYGDTLSDLASELSGSPVWRINQRQRRPDSAWPKLNMVQRPI